MSSTIQRGHAGTPEAGAERGQVPERGLFARLISAFINALLLVPALTALAGRAAWWPAAQATAH